MSIERADRNTQLLAGTLTDRLYRALNDAGAEVPQPLAAGMVADSSSETGASYDPDKQVLTITGTVTIRVYCPATGD